MRAIAAGLLVAFVFTCPAVAADLAVTVVAHPEEVPHGIDRIPIVIEVANVGGKPLRIGQLWAEVTSTDFQGRSVVDPRLMETAWPRGWALTTSAEVVPPGWRLLAVATVGYTTPPGPPEGVIASIGVTSYMKEERRAGDLPLWRGEIRSQDVRISITPPVGVDKSAYDAFGGSPLSDSRRLGRLLHDYPTSTYAAYVIYRSECAGGLSPSAAMHDVQWYAARPQGHNCKVPDDTGKSEGGWLSLWGEEAASWCGRWIETGLDAHPDIWFASQLRLSQAVNAIRMKKYDVAAAHLRELAEDGSAGVFSGLAQEYLDAMDRSGMSPRPLEMPSPDASLR